MATGYAEAITTPVLIVGAGRDRIVDTSADARVRSAPAARQPISNSPMPNTKS